MILVRLLMLACLNGWATTHGVAPHYARGVMQGVAITRGLAQVPCMVSSDAVGIAEWVYVYGVNTGALRYCKVIDTSETIDRARHKREKRIVEVSHEDAILFCGTTRDRPEACPVIVVSEYRMP